MSTPDENYFSEILDFSDSTEYDGCMKRKIVYSNKEMNDVLNNWDDLLTPEEYALKLEEDYYYALGEIAAENWWSFGK